MANMTATLVILVSIIMSAMAIDCKYDTGDGHKWDLRKLNEKSYIGIDNYYHYALRPCGISSFDPDCKSHGAGFCVLDKTAETYIAAVGKWNGNPVPTWGPADGDPSKGVQLSYDNGDQFNGRDPTVYIKYLCDKTATNPKTFDVTLNAISTTFTVTFKTEWGCSNHLPFDDEDTGLSGGSIFLIIFFVVVPVYIAAGCLYKYKQNGTKGIESCPNIDFWRSLPGLCMDGCKYSWRKIQEFYSRLTASASTAGAEKL